MTPEKPLNPRSITDAEAPWIEAWMANPHETHRTLLVAIKSMATARVANNVCSYVGARAIGEDPEVGSPSRALYRKILAQLADEGVAPPPPRGMRPEVVTPSSYDVGRSSAGADGGSIRSTSASVSARRRRPQMNPAMAVIVDELARRRAQPARVAAAAHRSGKVDGAIPGLVKLPVHSGLPMAA